MDYNTAITQARQLAFTDGDIYVVWTYSGYKQWLCTSYSCCELLDASQVRYVLPNGEVTKLI
jgi:hypothetical protein